MSDVLTGGDEPARGPARRRALVGLLLVLLLVGAADRWQGTRERGRLLEAVTAGEGAIEASQTSIAALTEYSGRLLHDADVPVAARRSAYDNLARDARRWRPRLERVRDDVAAAPVLPWHRQHRAAHEAYEQRLTAWIDVLAAFAAAPEDGFGDGAADSRRTARDALLTAGIDERRVRELLG